MIERVDRVLTRRSTAARPHFLSAGALGSAMALVVVAQAALLAHVIALVVTRRASLGAVETSLWWLAGTVMARALIGAGFELSGRLGAARVMGELRHRLAEALLLHSPWQSREEPTGTLTTAAVQGVDSLEHYFAGYLPAMVTAVTVPAAVIVWVLRDDPICAVIFIVTIPILVTFMILIGLGANAVSRRRWETLALLSGHFLDVVSGLETLRAHGRDRAQVDTITRAGEQYRSETMRTLRLAFMSALVLECCAMVGTALVAATIGVQLTGGRLTLEAGLCVLLLAPELYAPLRSVGQQFHASADGLAAAGDLLEVIGRSTPADSNRPATAATPAAPATPATPATPDPRRHPIVLRQVSVTYPGRTEPALPPTTATIHPGRMTAVTGPSGAGKSTLAGLLLGLLGPSGGSITCAGIPLDTVGHGAWHRRVAWVPQRVTLFRGTLADNVALAEPGAAPAAVQEAARAAGLAELIDQLPHGLDTEIGDGGRQLSAGQRQRVGVARALLSDASLVVLDEPTANLDRATADRIIAAILALATGRTVLAITHDATLRAVCDDVLDLTQPAPDTRIETQADTQAGTQAETDLTAQTPHTPEHDRLAVPA